MGTSRENHHSAPHLFHTLCFAFVCPLSFLIKVSLKKSKFVPVELKDKYERGIPRIRDTWVQILAWKLCGHGQLASLRFTFSFHRLRGLNKTAQVRGTA